MIRFEYIMFIIKTKINWPSKHLLVLKASSTCLQRNSFKSFKTSWRRREDIMGTNKFVLSIVLPREVLKKIISFWVFERLFNLTGSPFCLKLFRYASVIVWFACFKIRTVTVLLSETFNFTSKNWFPDLLVNVEKTTT